MKLGAILEAVRGLDRFSGYVLGERDAGKDRLAVDQDRAGAAAALTAAEFRRLIADLLTQRGKQVGAAVDENRCLAAVVSELQGGLGHGTSLSSAVPPEKQAA